MEEISKEGRLQGDGIFDFIKNRATPAFINAVIYGRNDYQPKVRDILAKYGDTKIVTMEVRRTPLSMILMSALNIASFGKIAKTNPYDKLFHLSIAVKLETGETLLIEKNEVINMEVNPFAKPNTETVVIKLNKFPILKTLMENTRNMMGQNYFMYSARNNNCQDFIINVLQSNNLSNPTVYDFVKQDTVKVFGDMVYLRKFVNTLTDIGGRTNVLQFGNGELSKKNGLSDTELKMLLFGVKNFIGIYSKDLLPPKLKKNSWYIINLEDSDDGDGTHWTCFKTGKVLEYYDPFGFPPPMEVMERQKKGGIDWTDKQIQNEKSTACGWFCVARIKSNMPFHQFIDYFSNDSSKNDLLLKMLLDWID